jgi:hypothetical protein
MVRYHRPLGYTSNRGYTALVLTHLEPTTEESKPRRGESSPQSRAACALGIASTAKPWSLPRRESWSQVSATPNLRPRAPGKCRCALAKRLPRRAPSAAAVTLRLESWSQASATLLGQGRATSSSAAWCLRRLPPRWETCPCREPWSPTPLGESPGKCPPLRVGGRLRSSGGCAG